MPKKYINPDSLFPSLDYGFSQIVATSGRTTIHISGQTAWDRNKQIVGGRDLAQQARQALRNVQITEDSNVISAKKGDVTIFTVETTNKIERVEVWCS